MSVHNNVYIPRESWPYWTWFAIEFFILLAASALIANEVVLYLEQQQMVLEPTTQNWVFWSIVGLVFLVWYVIIRSKILKRRILENSYYR